MDCTRTLALFWVHSLSSFENSVLFLKFCSSQKLWHMPLLEAVQYLSLVTEWFWGQGPLSLQAHSSERLKESEVDASIATTQTIWQLLDCFTNFWAHGHRFAVIIFCKTRNWVFLSQYSALIYSWWFVSVATRICSASCCTCMPLQPNFSLSFKPSVFSSHLPNLTTLYSLSFLNFLAHSSILRLGETCIAVQALVSVRMRYCWAFRDHIWATARSLVDSIRSSGHEVVSLLAWSSHGLIPIAYNLIPHTLTTEWLHEQIPILDGRQTNWFVLQVLLACAITLKQITQHMVQHIKSM